MSSTRKLSELIGEYTAKNPNLKSMTRLRREYIWRLLIESAGDIDIADFGYCQAEDFQQWLYGRDLSPSSVKSYRKDVQSMMRWSWRRGYRLGDPFDGLSQPKTAQSEIRVYTEAEVQALLAAAHNKIWRARILAAVSAGLRKSEVQNLCIGDVNFERNYISVQGKKETAYTWCWSAKNYHLRRVPLCESLSRLLAEIIDELQPGQPYLLLSEQRYFGIQQLRAKGMSDRIRMCPDENVRPWRNILAATQIKGTFHDLRRTAITRWTWNMPPQDVKKLAGHADIATTMEYYAAVSSDIILRAANCSIV